MNKLIEVLCLFLALAAIGSAQSAPPSRANNSGFQRPDAGYTRQIGLIPGVRDLGLPKRSGAMALMDDATTMTADRGLPVGGIGTGSFEINQYGTFGPWNFGAHETRILPQAAFHVREAFQGGKPMVETLATSGRLGALPQAWPAMPPGSATYKALYPFGWIDYKGFSANVQMRFWSPIVAGEDERTSMPVVYFDFSISNPANKEDDVSVMFTFPNAPIHLPSSAIVNWMTNQPMYIAPSIRTGFNSRFEVDSKTGVQAVTLGASDPSNTIDAQDTEWTIGVKPKAGQRVTYVTSWDSENGAKSILDAFRRSGQLPNQRLDTSNSAGAIAISVTLKPHETQTLSFILAWDIPRERYVARSRAQGGPPPGLPSPASGAPSQTASAEGRATARIPEPPREIGTTVWMKRYTAYFGGRETNTNDYIEGSYLPHQGFNIAKRMLGMHDEALTAVRKWWAPFAENRVLPAWLRSGALNQISYNVSGHSFWEAGLVSNTVPPQAGRRLGTVIPGTHMFFVDCGSEGGDESALNGDVTPYGFMHWQELFPNLEKQMLLAMTEGTELNPSTNFMNLGFTDSGSPFVTWEAEPPNTHIDHQILYVFRLWRYVRDNNDDELFRNAYPQLLRIYSSQKAGFFTAGDHLPVDGRLANTHDDMRVSGHGVYNSQLWLLNDYILIEATKRARSLGLPGATKTFISELEADLAAAKKDFEDQFWMESEGHYRFDTGQGTPSYRESLFADGMYAQHLAQTLGLPSLTDPQRLIRHLKAIYMQSAQPFRGADGYLVGPTSLLTNEGKPFPPPAPGANPFAGGVPPEATETWPGVDFPLAALMITTGRDFHDLELTRYGLELGEGVARQIWTKPENGYAFQAPEAWRVADVGHHRNPDYLRPLSIWDLLKAWPSVVSSGATRIPAAISSAGSKSVASGKTDSN